MTHVLEPPAPTRSGRATARRVLILVGLAAVLWTFLALTVKRHGFFDLSVYHGALASWVRDGGSLYDYAVPDSVFGFTYPPFAALVMVPMVWTPWGLTVVISVVVTIACAAAVFYLLINPMARRRGWAPWFAVAIAVVIAPAFEPFAETLLFGQINLVLVLLVTADMLLLVSRGSRFGGVGIGLAMAIKLTPGIFIVYLLVTKRWRAAIIASGTAAAATLLAAAIAPEASRQFWTSALWNTSRVGDLDFISNQSIMGAVARWNPTDPSTLLEILAALVAGAIWFVRVRRAYAAGDQLTSFALTGVLGCLVSPVTWIHHLVWLTPALVLLVDNVFQRHASPVADSRQQRQRFLLLGALIFAVGVLCTRLVWRFHNNYDNPVTWLFSNGYLWLTLILLLILPIRRQLAPPDDSAPAQPALA